MIEINGVYSKIYKTIQSCENEKHARCALTMLMLAYENKYINMIYHGLLSTAFQKKIDELSIEYASVYHYK